MMKSIFKEKIQRLESKNTTMSIYLDYNATTPLRDEVKKEMLDIMGLPECLFSSFFGRQAKTHLENARTQFQFY